MQSNHFQKLNDDDMVSISYDDQYIYSLGLTEFTIREFYTSLRGHLRLTDQELENYHWLGDGVEASLLKAKQSNSGWISGRVKLCLAFQSNHVEAKAIISPGYSPHDEDVLTIENESTRWNDRKSSLISQVIASLRRKLNINDSGRVSYYWFDRGIECRVLKANGETAGWQYGLIRLQLEFTPASEQVKNNGVNHTSVGNSDLDSLRQLVN